MEVLHSLQVARLDFAYSVRKGGSSLSAILSPHVFMGQDPIVGGVT